MAEDEDHPLWGRALAALICLGGSVAIGWLAGGIGGMILGAVIGLGLAFFAFLVPSLVMGILTVLEILGSCS